MCDNCRTGLKVVEQDFSAEAKKIAEFVRINQNYKTNVTLKMVVEIFKGRKLQKSFIRADIVQMFSGALKHLKEADLRRMIIKMLMLGFLEETFVSMKVQQSTNVSVYITLGRHMNRLDEGRAKLMLSHGVEHSNLSFHEEDKPALALAKNSPEAQNRSNLKYEAPKYKKADL